LIRSRADREGMWGAGWPEKSEAGPNPPPFPYYKPGKDGPPAYTLKRVHPNGVVGLRFHIRDVL
jgi:hypothetical protein